MKKTILLIAAAFGISQANAQDLTSKKGEPILPEANDWAISMNADPIFEFVGNAFNGNTGNSAPGANWLNGNQTIVGKKFIDEKSAYRVLVRIGYINRSYKNSVVVDPIAIPGPVFPTQPDRVTDKFSHKSTNIAIGVGKEMRRGKTRLQGFYGADIMIWITTTSDKFTYGNTMSADSVAGLTVKNPTSTQWDTDPTSADFGSVVSSNKVTSRVTLNKSGMVFGVGIRGFIGAEYFIFPKIAIGAEYGWGIGFQSQGKGKTSTEEQGGSPNQVAVIERPTEGSSIFGVDTDLNQQSVFGFKGSNTGNVSLKVTFHF